MIKIRNGRLSRSATDKLSDYQAEVDTAGDYAEQVAAAKSKFSQRNRVSNPTFNAIKAKLTDMCNGSRRCMYCEDSVADEVEHFKPKDLYPELVFVWKNYFYACGPCNGPKNNRFSIINPVSRALVDVTRSRGAPVLRPMHGSTALIDPRHENPLQFLMLDLRDTFAFTPLPVAGAEAYERARYTIDVLRLNDRDYLIDARRNALGGFKARLEQYIHRRDDGASIRTLARFRRGIQAAPHLTVWEEMKRQHPHHEDLANLFGQAPEALAF